MKNRKKILIGLIILVFSLLTSTLLWKYISLTYYDSTIIGNYSLNSYNAYSDLFRYLFFVLFPIITFVIFRAFNEQNLFANFVSNLRKKDLNYYNLEKTSFYLFLIFFLFLILQFLSINFPIYPMDIYHEGQRLSSAYKSSLDNSLWSGSYVIVGIFYETIASKLSWGFFDTISVGGARFVDLMLILISKILITIVAFQISNYSNLKLIYKSLLFFILFLIFQNLSNYNLGSVDLLTYREIPILLIVILFPLTINNKIYSYAHIIILGTLSTPTFFWGLDRGIIYNLLCLSIIFYFVFLKNYLKISFFVISILLSWFFFWLILGEEFYLFISNSVSILNEINYIHGIIHPVPFSEEPNATRATKHLILIILSIIISLNLFVKENKKYSYNFKIFLFLISLFCFFSYLNAIGRSDGPHMRSVFGYPIVFVSVFFIFNAIFLLQKITENYFNDYKKINITLFVLFVVINLFYFDIKPKNISNFENRLDSFVNYHDQYYINEDYYNFIEYSKKKLSNIDCIQVFTNDSAMLYLLRKKNCTKYYFVWSVGSEKNQKKFIKELNNTNIIIEDKPKKENNLSPSFKLPLVKKFIDNNYNLLFSYYNYRVLQKNN